METLKSALRTVFIALSSSRCQQEAMIKIDFKIGEARANWMQLCFAALADWPLVGLLIFLYFSSTIFSWTLQKTFQNQTDFVFWLLDGRIANMSLFFVMFFVLQWALRNEVLLINALFYFLLKSDIHFYLALSALTGIFISQNLSMWWLHRKLVSDARNIWRTATALELLGSALGGLFIFCGLQYLQFNGFFSSSAAANRSEFFFYAFIFVKFLQFLLTTVWGHFRFQRKIEPTNFPICYSTSRWLGKINLRADFKKLVLQQVQSRIQLHQKNLDELVSIKDLGPVSIPFKISQILQAELSFLKIACSRLTIE